MNFDDITIGQRVTCQLINKDGCVTGIQADPPGAIVTWADGSGAVVDATHLELDERYVAAPASHPGSGATPGRSGVTSSTMKR